MESSQQVQPYRVQPMPVAVYPQPQPTTTVLQPIVIPQQSNNSLEARPPSSIPTVQREETNHLTVSTAKLGDLPVNAYCNICRSVNVTYTERKAGCCAITLAIVFFFVLGPFSLFFLCCDCVKETRHYCPRCHNMIGKNGNTYMCPQINADDVRIITGTH